MADYSNSTGLSQDLIDLLGDPRQQIQDQAQQQRLGLSLPASPASLPVPQVNAAATGVASSGPSEMTGTNTPSDETEETPKPPPAPSSSDESDSTATPDAPQSVRDYLMQKYGFGPGMDTAALVKAQKQAQQSKYETLMEEGLAKMGAAFSRGQVTPDRSFYQQLGQAGQAPVQNILAQRAAQTQGLQNEAQIGTQSSAQEASDPNSSYSKLIQKNYSGLLTKMGMRAEGIQGLSGQQIEEGLQNPLKLKASYDETMAKIQEAAQMKQLMLQNSQARFDAGQAQHAQDKLQGDKQYTDALTHVSTSQKALADLDAARTNPVAYSLLPIEVIRGLVQGRISNQEIQKASGGQDLDSWLQRIMKTGSQGTITDRDYNGFRQMLQTAQTRAQTDLQSAQQRHIGTYSQLSGKTPERAQQLLTGSSTGQQQPQAAAPQAQFTPDVLNYAQSHGISPQQALQIKMQRTGGGAQ